MATVSDLHPSPPLGAERLGEVGETWVGVRWLSR